MSKLKTNLTATVESDQPNERAEVDSCHDPDEFGEKFLPTLPPGFKSLFGKLINTRDAIPRRLIESLGDILGVTDYSTNEPAFWFLDTLAGQVLKHSKDLDEYNTTVLVSWLAGEIKMLRERQYLREEFFTEMKNIFTEAASKVVERHRLLYWDEIICTDAEEEWDELLAIDQSQDRYLVRSYEFLFDNVGTNSESLQTRSSRETVQSNTTDPICALNIVIECTYDMYGNELRYSLVYKVFVEPVPVKIYQLPFTFRHPRPVKLAEPKIPPPGSKLHKGTKKQDGTERSKKSPDRGKGKGKAKSTIEVPVTPVGSLDDEQLLIQKRMFILPLIESREATEMFEERANFT